MDIKNIESIRPILEKSNVEFAGIFGSHVKGTEKTTSDIDILVRFNAPISLSKFSHLKKELHDTLHVSVDLVTEQSLSPYLKGAILKDLHVIYGTR